MHRIPQGCDRGDQTRKAIDKFAFLRVANKAEDNAGVACVVDKFAFLRAGDVHPGPTYSTAITRLRTPSFYSNLRSPGCVGAAEIGSFCFQARPRQVGFFSEMDSGKIQTFDRRELKAFRPPIVPTKIMNGRLLLLGKDDNNLEPLSIKLTTGIRSWIEWDTGVKEQYGRLFNWILLNQNELRRKFRRPTLQRCCENAEFVCSANLLVDLALAPYGDTAQYVNVVRWHDVLFLVKARRGGGAAWDKTGHFMTDKFGNLVTCDVGDQTQPWRHPGDAVDSRTRFSAVFRSDVHSANNAAGHRLLYDGGIDCVDERGKYVAAKVARVLTEEKRLSTFYGYKMLNLGLKCCFTGVDRLVVGFHDPKGKLVQIGEFDVDSIPQQAAAVLEESAWEPSVCMNFLDAFLSEVKERITVNDINAVYQVFIPSFCLEVRAKSELRFERLTEICESGTGFEYLQSFSDQFN